MASDWMGVCIAPDDDLLTVSPTWTRLDDGVSGLRVASIQIDRGKTSEFEETDTGTCTVTFNDRAGILNPKNASSPLYGKMISSPFAVAIRDPVTDEWFPLFRGAIDEAGHDLHPSQLITQTAVVAVDAFDYFANYELIPGLAGFSNGLPNNGGYVFYEDANWDDGIFAILADAGWPTGLSSIFSGNIVLRERTYSPGDNVLDALREAVMAEFPTVAAMYVDKAGLVQCHGRYARFDPDTVSASATNWTFNRWKAGDNAAAAAVSDRAKLQPPFGFQESRKLIRNAALAYPQGTDRSDLGDYISTDETSRGLHGTRTWLAENLQILEETTLGLTAKEFCQYISDYIVGNYAYPVPRIPQLSFGSERPEGTFGPATWELITGVDISDVVDVAVDLPDGSAFSEEYYVEGVHYLIEPGPGSLDNSWPKVKLTLDMSPASYWATNPFGSVPT